MKLTCSTDEIDRLRPEMFKQILDSDTQGEFQLLDVRMLQEYEAGHIPGAKWIALDELEYRYKELKRNSKIIIYCRSGHRSMAAGILLCGLGFKHIFNLEGGIRSWQYDTIKGTAREGPELITGIEDIGDILILALMFEKGALDFYSKAQEMIKDEKAVKCFKDLEIMEEEHLKKLYQHYNQLPWDMEMLLGTDKLPPLNRLKEQLSTIYMEGGIKINEELIKFKDLEFIDDLEALEIALEKEYISYDFYKRTIGSIGDRKTKTLLYELAIEEQNHINVLLQQINKHEGNHQQ
jgi:rhodanese-related sulfurtransferase